MIWSKFREYDPLDTDPNYCIEEMYSESHFHKALIKWMNSLGQDEVPFHIDIHGKINRKGQRCIDLGIEPIFEAWPYEDPKNTFAKAFKTNSEI